MRSGECPGCRETAGPQGKSGPAHGRREWPIRLQGGAAYRSRFRAGADSEGRPRIHFASHSALSSPVHIQSDI